MKTCYFCDKIATLYYYRILSGETTPRSVCEDHHPDSMNNWYHNFRTLEEAQAYLVSEHLCPNPNTDVHNADFLPPTSTTTYSTAK